jgi:hypothetical protein
LQQLYQDGMAIVRKLGKADLFITFTCNPKWPEIVKNLLPGQTAADRPDLVARVFQLRLRHLLKQLLDEGVFGEVLGHLVTIEWQKRGLPHAHILLILKAIFRLQNSDHFDSVVCAEFPRLDGSKAEAELHEKVLKHMVHGPCGVHNPTAPCMLKGKCKLGFPKAFRDTTSEDEKGFPLYRRRNTGQAFTKKVKGVEVEVDNRWIVPCTYHSFNRCSHLYNWGS